MRHLISRLTRIFSIVFLITPYFLFGQEPQQKRLELQRNQLEQEIKNINSLLFSNFKQKKSVLNEVQDLSLKIDLRERLIRVNNEQANQLNHKILINERNVNDLKTQLLILKKDYSEMIQKSYNSKSKQSRLMFLFSSESFLQAYKRFQYIKQYANFRKNQGELIATKSQTLQSLNNELYIQKELKQKIVQDNRKVQFEFRKEKNRQNSLIGTLKNKEKSFKKQIDSKQRKSEAISNEIQRLIKEAISESNRKAGKRINNDFALSPEALLISNNFISNKGKLPWPVEKGVVVQVFGKHPHPLVKTAIIQSNGVIISTPEKTIARSIFDGIVMSILSYKGSNPTILVQHGNYISAYSNMGKVYVKKGDKVKLKQPLGEVFTNPTSARTDLKFSIFKSNTPLNPKGWIYKL